MTRTFLLSMVFLSCGCPGPQTFPLPADSGVTDTPVAAPTAPLLDGSVSVRTTPRPDFGALAVRTQGALTYVLEARRDAAGKSERRFRVLAGDALQWELPADADAFIDDFTVHPSGAVTLAIERLDEPQDSYRLVRFTADGTLTARQKLPSGDTVPARELADLPRPAFRMKSAWNSDAYEEGWLRVAANGEDAVVAFQTEVRVPDGQHTFDLVSGVMWLRWGDAGYSEIRTHLVDGRHGVGPAAWAYDEFRWRQQAVRPYLSVDPIDGTVVVGRAWSNPRCRRAFEIFGEGSKVDCVLKAVSPVENERLPFAWTSFSADGTREGTQVVIPEDAREFVVFDMQARDGLVALAGTIVREGAPYYGGNLVPYDGYVAILDRATAAARVEKRIDGDGHGDVLSALRFTHDGVVAVGAAGWDRWNGGMSVSRGASPLLAFVGLDGTVKSRVLSGGSGDRHSHLLGVDVGDRLVAVGVSEAPMTHSTEMTFGGFAVELK